MNKSRFFVLTCTCLFTIASVVTPLSSRAALIEHTFNVTPSNSIIFQTTDNAGNFGKQIEFVSDTTPFFLNSGDVINTYIVFNTPLRITDTNNGFWSSNAINPDNWEPTNFIYWLTIDGSNSNASATVSYSISFDIASGTPAINPLNGSNSGGGGGITAARKLTDSNITDSSVVINGLTIQSNISSYTLNSGTGEFSLFQGILQAGDISFIPLPPALWLFGSGLLGLIGIGRKKQINQP